MPKFMTNHTIKAVETPAVVNSDGKITKPAVLKTYKQGDIVECTDEQFEFYKKSKTAMTESQIRAWQDRMGSAPSDDKVPDLATSKSLGNTGSTADTRDTGGGDTGKTGSEQSTQAQSQAAAQNQTGTTDQTSGGAPAGDKTADASKTGKAKGDGSVF